ncbi:hypothetical protein Tco_1471057, partial [Tanacetum coccineum]
YGGKMVNELEDSESEVLKYLPNEVDMSRHRYPSIPFDVTKFVSLVWIVRLYTSVSFLSSATVVGMSLVLVVLSINYIGAYSGYDSRLSSSDDPPMIYINYQTGSKFDIVDGITKDVECGCQGSECEADYYFHKFVKFYVLKNRPLTVPSKFVARHRINEFKVAILRYGNKDFPIELHPNIVKLSKGNKQMYLTMEVDTVKPEVDDDVNDAVQLD